MTQTTPLTTQPFELFCFEVGKRVYALSADQVIALIGRRQTVSPNPEWPSWANRTMGFRGQDIPVVNTRLRFGLPEPRRAVILFVIEVGDQTIGIAADKVRHKCTIPINTPIIGIPDGLSDIEKICVNCSLIALPETQILCLCLREFLNPLIPKDTVCLACHGIGA